MKSGAAIQRLVNKAARRLTCTMNFSRFFKDQSGASALEFALVATPLILLLLAVLQVGIVYFSNFTLEGATERGARLIRTGQAQNQGFDAAKFKSEVCKHLSAPLTCADLKLDVRSYPSFAGAASDLTDPMGSDGQMKSDFSYNPGNGGDVVVVRAFYPLDIGSVLPAEISLSNMDSGGRLLVATAAFRNEPFAGTGSSGRSSN
ncbi:MAG: TadE/TadG family type IV pilus assembly protein [Methyloceanibacter sp.]|uniref:TadE/TadG family type IV pilus assembly protein n=1 Tax=Methyloceanibacter sp. TaxID=1965321 RepID=UPI003D6D069F